MSNTVNIKQNFYQGQKVAPEHLNKLQDYSDNSTNNLVSNILGYGVVQGLDLSILEEFTVEVSSGSAFNQKGEHLYVSSGASINLQELSPSAEERTIKIGIKKVFAGSKPILNSLGENVDTVLTPSVEFVTGLSLETDVFELGEIILNAVGIVSVNKTALELMTISKQAQKTKDLSCTAEQADLITQIINITGDNTNINGNNQLDLQSPLINVEGTRTNINGNEQLNFESPLINLVTQNLMINDTPYNEGSSIEMGSNNNGYYVKFDNGLLINRGSVGLRMNHIWEFPMAFSPLHNISSISVLLAIADHNHTRVYYKNLSNSSVNIVKPECNDAEGSAVAIGFWK